MEQFGGQLRPPASNVGVGGGVDVVEVVGVGCASPPVDASRSPMV
jgi:hypothetical protein